MHTFFVETQPGPTIGDTGRYIVPGPDRYWGPVG